MAAETQVKPWSRLQAVWSRARLRDRALVTARRAWMRVGVVLVAAVLLEGVLRVGFMARDYGRPFVGGVVAIDRLQATNPGQAWIHAYHDELHRVQSQAWTPFVYWRTKPFAGRFINVDAQGLRHTWNATPAAAPGQMRIFMFGGTSVWGYAARDEFTIPSLVSKRLAGSLKTPPWVVNLAEFGYVSTQEVLTLLFELRKGNVPDLAVFYHGVNDGWAAIDTGMVGAGRNEDDRVQEFLSRHRLNLREGFVEKTALYRLWQAALGGSGRAEPPVPLRAFDQAVVDAVISTYLGNVRLVNGLAREYGFRPVFFLQPTVYSKDTLSADEERWRLAAGRRVIRRRPVTQGEAFWAFDQAFKQKMKASAIPNVYDLSSVFARDTRTIFLDRFHVSEPGNEKIAEAITLVLREIVSDGGAVRSNRTAVPR